jgi:phosphatidate cytidylyltransferase
LRLDDDRASRGVPGGRPPESAERGVPGGRPSQSAEREVPGPRPPEPGERVAPGRGRGAAAERKQINTGRNLPAALAVGIGLGGLVFVTLFTVKATFLLYVGIMVGLALWELSHAFAERGIQVPFVPVAAGGVAMVTLAYWVGPKPALVAVALTAIAVLAWRLPSGVDGYVRDVTAGIFALAYLPLFAVFVALMLAEPDGTRRVLLFVILAVCSDTFGYLAGILVGKHPLAPVISPKKTWEGLTGSILGCLAAGAIGVPGLLHGHVWQGLLLGAAAVAAATLGDLVESMMKRDLKIKDMGHLLPGHGGVLDRIDSLLVIAPVVWLLLLVFIPNGQAG